MKSLPLPPRTRSLFGVSVSSRITTSKIAWGSMFDRCHRRARVRLPQIDSSREILMVVGRVESLSRRICHLQCFGVESYFGCAVEARHRAKVWHGTVQYCVLGGLRHRNIIIMIVEEC
eukprot:scaffold148520_cov43-Cyclotella_meneghiniana.AAC.3